MLWNTRTLRLRLWRITAIAVLTTSLSWGVFTPYASAKHAPNQEQPLRTQSREELLQKRKAIYDKIAAKTHIPWVRLAAIDQYERTIAKIPKKTTKATSTEQDRTQRAISISVQEPQWVGWLNPDTADQNPKSISLFSGMGKDGSGDGVADPNNDLDLLYSVASFVKQYGTSDDDFSIGLWHYYQNTRAVQRINQFAKIYAAFGKVQLDAHAFPLPLHTDYSYRSTWGTNRSWGGFRIHEGTDLFASYGVPVRSTCYGIIETKGWNPFGGWRIGIRDLSNYYHYYAHMSGFAKNLKVNDVVTPGQVIGWVGSSGYGKPGTQGKFPPHLHYGIYRDRGLIEWSFDPYPLLRKWENDERKANKKK